MTSKLNRAIESLTMAESLLDDHLAAHSGYMAVALETISWELRKKISDLKAEEKKERDLHYPFPFSR